MISKKLTPALSEQVNVELYSAYLYLAMSADADRMGFKGIAHWLYVQFQEEMEHGLHIHKYILERGEKPAYAAIEAPAADFDSLDAMFEKVLAHERYVTERINHIATLAMQECDHATYHFIMWYVNEQVEEEASADDILQKLKFLKDNVSMILTLDAELGTRVFINPFANTKA